MKPEEQAYFTRAKVPAEDEIFCQLVRPGMSVLDVGCGEGRCTEKLRALTENVWAIDANTKALPALRRRMGRDFGVKLAAADMRNLPFPDAHFDLLLAALSGIDYLLSKSDRAKALCEFDRVLRPGGYCVFSSVNRLGVVLSPRSPTKMALLKWRLRHVLSGRFLRRSLIDSLGVDLYQSMPQSVIREVTTNTGMDFVFATNKLASTKNLLLISLFSAWPYYVFNKK